MADEPEAIVPTEQAAPAIGTEVANDEPEVILEPGEAEAGDGDGSEANAEPAVEYVTLERNGRQYQVPKELEGEFLMQADYTRKTQSAAERQKELDARAEALEQQSKVSEDELKERATLINVNAKLEQYAKVDWDALEAQDPMGAQKHWRNYQTLQQQQADLSGKLKEKETTRTQSAQQDFAKRVEETAAFAQANIPGWKPELDEQIVKFALSKGVSQDFLRKNMSPTFYAFAHLAYVGNQTLTKQAVPKSLTSTVVPLKTVGGKSTPAASADLASADMDAYVAARKKGVGGKPLR